MSEDFIAGEVVENVPMLTSTCNTPDLQRSMNVNLYGTISGQLSSSLDLSPEDKIPQTIRKSTDQLLPTLITPYKRQIIHTFALQRNIAVIILYLESSSASNCADSPCIVTSIAPSKSQACDS